MADEPQNLGLNPVRQIYSAGTSEFAEYCRRLDHPPHKEPPGLREHINALGGLATDAYHWLMGEYYD